MNPETPQFYLNVPDTWEAMLRACEGARDCIDLEQYIFEEDTIGNRFVEVLRKKAREGIKVRVLCDAVGSWFLLTSRLPWLMRKDGIEVRFVNVVSPWRVRKIFSWFFRDHRKILIVDKEVGFTGSSGISDVMQNWRDTNIQVQSGIVAEMQATFNDMWAQAAEKKIMRRIRKGRDYARGFQFVTNSPRFRKRFLYNAIVDALRNARSYAHLTTPYFVPDRRLVRVLKLAVQRGVEVKIILPKEVVEPLVGYAVHTFYESMLRAGVKIFEYQKGFMHAKTIVIDDEWATAGSFNLDSLSFVYNYEANIVSTDQNFVQSLKSHFIEDLSNCEEVLLDSWLRRPFTQKVVEFFIRPFRRFL